jgi:hypothetical protein
MGLVGRPPGEDPSHPGAGEHQSCSIRRIVGVHGDVGRPDGEHPEDGHVEVGRPGSHSDPDTGAAPHAVRGEQGGNPAHLDLQRCIVEAPRAVVDRRVTGVGGGRGGKDVEQRAWGSGAATEMYRAGRGDGWARWPSESRRSRGREGTGAGRADSCWMHAGSSWSGVGVLDGGRNGARRR